MKRFFTILKFELKGYLTNKIFVGITLFLVVLIVGVMFFPRVAALFDDGDDQMTPEDGSTIPSPDNSDAENDGADGDRSVIYLLSGSVDDSVMKSIRESFAQAFPEYNVILTDESVEDVKNHVTSGDVECAFAFSSPTEYTYYVNNLSMYDSNTFIADEVLTELYRMTSMVNGGLSPEEASEILSAYVTHTTETLGQDQMQNYFYTYIMIYALYIVIILYGQLVATSVASEKSSRAMEVLVTSAKPLEMMFGKVTASCLAGLSQLVVVFGAALASFSINESYWGGNEIVRSIFDMPPSLFVYMLVFFVLGFLVYAFLYGAVGSTASKLEDINTSSMPITMLFLIGFFVVIFGMSASNVDSVIMRVCSYIPFTSPMAMFTRIAMSTVPAYEIAISISILAASVVGIGFFAAKIYRAGVLLYGTPPKLSAIIKAIKNA